MSVLPLSRRSLLGGAAIIATRGLARASDVPLRQIAASRGLLYGCACSQSVLAKDADLARLIARECAVIVPEWEMKWKPLEAVQGHYTYDAADQLVEFAENNGLKVRGHTLAWGLNAPDWAINLIKGGKGGDIFRRHVRDVAAHFGRKVFEWDVVNEAVEPRDNLPAGLRNSFLYQGLGPDWIEIAFRTAAEAVPHAKLYYNDYGLDNADRYSLSRRDAVLNLMRNLKSRGVPLHGLGIQAHLHARSWFDEKGFRAFLSEVAALGLEIKITELDVDDNTLLRDAASRDEGVATKVFRYLTTALDEPAVRGVLTWGLSDRASFRNTGQELAQRNGDISRCLPYDQGLSPKPFRDALARAFSGAPKRAG